MDATRFNPSSVCIACWQAGLAWRAAQRTHGGGRQARTVENDKRVRWRTTNARRCLACATSMSVLLRPRAVWLAVYAAASWSTAAGLGAAIRVALLPPLSSLSRAAGLPSIRPLAATIRQRSSHGSMHPILASRCRLRACRRGFSCRRRLGPSCRLALSCRFGPSCYYPHPHPGGDTRVAVCCDAWTLTVSSRDDVTLIVESRDTYKNCQRISSF